MLEDEQIEHEISLISKCYLAEFCLSNIQKENYDNNGFEINLLDWFCLNVMNSKDVKKCNEIAISINNKVKDLENNTCIYEMIYSIVILPVIYDILDKHYDDAYDNYIELISLLESEMLENTNEYILTFSK